MLRFRFVKGDGYMEGFLFRDDNWNKRIFYSSQIKGVKANLYTFIEYPVTECM